MWLAIEDGVVAWISFLTGGPPTRRRALRGTLPGGLTSTMRPSACSSCYGAPDRIQEIALAARRARRSSRFYEPTAPATVTFARAHAGPPARLDRIVLARRPS